MKKQYHHRKATTEDTQGVQSFSNYRLTLYNTKVVKAGRYLRVTRYRNRLQRKSHIKDPRYSVRTLKTTSTVNTTRRPDSIRRSIDKFMDNAHANTVTYRNVKRTQTRFIRLSFAPGNLPETRRQMFRWIQAMQNRYQKRFGYKMRYQLVDEGGTDDLRLHIHILVFEAPYLSNERWQELWQKGQVRALTPYDDGAGVYMTKYMFKEMPTKLSGTRLYSCSKNLLPVNELVQSITVKSLLDEAIAKGYIIRELGTANNDYRGLVEYELWLPPPN